MSAAARSGRIWEADVGEWDFIMRLNLRSRDYLCTTRGRGATLRQPPFGPDRSNLSSGNRAEGDPLDGLRRGQPSAYAAQRRRSTASPENVALELAEYGVTSNAVCAWADRSGTEWRVFPRARKPRIWPVCASRRCAGSACRRISRTQFSTSSPTKRAM
jgi:NAD(P)-dependent dehydrogenase (short-subunit alcohol dehydrogenase family)